MPPTQTQSGNSAFNASTVESTLDRFKASFPELSIGRGVHRDDIIVTGTHRSGAEIALVLCPDPVNHVRFGVLTPAHHHGVGWHVLEHLVAESFNGRNRPGLINLYGYSTLGSLGAETNQYATQYTCTSSDLPSLTAGIKLIAGGMQFPGWNRKEFLVNRGSWQYGERRTFEGVVFKELVTGVNEPTRAALTAMFSSVIPGTDIEFYHKSVREGALLSLGEVQDLWRLGYHPRNILVSWTGNAPLDFRLAQIDEAFSNWAPLPESRRLEIAQGVVVTGRRELSYATNNAEALGTIAQLSWMIDVLSEAESSILIAAQEIITKMQVSLKHTAFPDARLTCSPVKVGSKMIAGRVQFAMSTFNKSDQTVAPSIQLMRDLITTLANNGLDTTLLANSIRSTLSASANARRSPGYGANLADELVMSWCQGIDITNHTEYEANCNKALAALEHDPNVVKELFRRFLPGGPYANVEAIIRPVPAIPEAIPLPMLDEDQDDGDDLDVIPAFDDPTVVPALEVDATVADNPPHTVVQSRDMEAHVVVHGLAGNLEATPVSFYFDANDLTPADAPYAHALVNLCDLGHMTPEAQSTYLRAVSLFPQKPRYSLRSIDSRRLALRVVARVECDPPPESIGHVLSPLLHPDFGKVDEFKNFLARQVLAQPGALASPQNIRNQLGLRVTMPYGAAWAFDQYSTGLSSFAGYGEAYLELAHDPATFVKKVEEVWHKLVGRKRLFVCAGTSQGREKDTLAAINLGLEQVPEGTPAGSSIAVGSNPIREAWHIDDTYAYLWAFVPLPGVSNAATRIMASLLNAPYLNRSHREQALAYGADVTGLTGGLRYAVWQTGDLDRSWQLIDRSAEFLDRVDDDWLRRAKVNVLKSLHRDRGQVEWAEAIGHMAALGGVGAKQSKFARAVKSLTKDDLAQTHAVLRLGIETASIVVAANGNRIANVRTDALRSLEQRSLEDRG